jgi:hypothetical protein
MTRALPILILVACVALPGDAQAYFGPGAGLSLLGALWALLAAVGTAVAFIVAWPIRKTLKRRRAKAAREAAPVAPAGSGDSPAE